MTLKKVTNSLTGSMTQCKFLGVPVVQLSGGVEKVQLVAHADDGTARLSVYKCEVLFPVEVQVADNVVGEVLLQEHRRGGKI